MRTFLFITVLLAPFGLTAKLLAQDFAVNDPQSIDRDAPPGLVELKVPSHGEMMSAIIYTANGPGPHPTIILLHGFPGNEKNLDTAQALRRAGFNILFFHYRGAWGSGGTYSVKGLTADVQVAIDYLREKGKAGEYRIDPERISLLGHSLGGFAAIYGGINDTSVMCTVAIAPVDLGLRASAIDASTFDFNNPALTNPENGLGGYSASDLLQESIKHQSDFSLHQQMTAFKGRPLFIISGDKDTAVPLDIQKPMANAAKQAGAEPFEHIVMDADHSFSWSRIALNRLVVEKMTRHCR